MREVVQPEERSRRTRKKLLACARLIIGEQGIDKLTMDRLAAVSGMSKGGVMYQFKTRQALVSALLAEYAEHMTVMLQSAQDRYDTPSANQQAALIPAYLDWYKGFDQENHGWARIGVMLWDEQASDPELLEPVRAWYRDLFARIEEFPAADQGKALLSVMALEGFFCLHKFGLDVMKPGLKQKAFAQLDASFPAPPRKKAN